MIEPGKRKNAGSFPINLVNSAPQMMQLFEDEQGFIHLGCLCSPYQMTKWCKHVEAVYTDSAELDAEHITSTCGVQLYKSPHSLSLDTLVLPIGDSGDDVDTTLCEVQVLWGNISKSPGSGLVVDGQYSIGFIRRGTQGRKAIRRLIFEWLVAIPVMFPDKMVCTSTAHKKGDSYFDEHTAKDEHTDLKKDYRTAAEMTSWRNRDSVMLLDEKMCYSCAQVVMRPFDSMGIDLSKPESRFIEGQSGTSSHFYIDTDGQVHQTSAPEAWHKI